MSRCTVALNFALFALSFLTRYTDAVVWNATGSDPAAFLEQQPAFMPPAVDKTDIVLQTREQVDDFLKKFSRRSVGFIELGKVVKPFTSYLDVSITHFKIPASSETVLFEWSAYKRPRNCLQQYANETIIIYFQHGAIPLVEESFFSLPLRIYVQRTQIFRTSMIADQRSHYFKLSSPQPGDWYSVAFLDPMLSRAVLTANSPSMSVESRILQASRKCSIVLTSTMHMAPIVEAIQDVIFESLIAKNGPVLNPNNELLANESEFATFQSSLSVTKPRVLYRLPAADGLSCSVHVELNCTKCRAKFRPHAVPDAGSGEDIDMLLCNINGTTKKMPICSSFVTLRPDALTFLSVESLGFAGMSFAFNQSCAISLTKFCCPMPLREPFLRSPHTHDKHSGENSHNFTSKSAVGWRRQQLMCPSTYERLSRIDYGQPFSSRFFIKRSILPFLQDLLFIPTHYRSVQAFQFELDQQDSGGTFWLRLDTQPPYTEALESGKIDVQFCLGKHRMPLKLIQPNEGAEPEVWCDASSIIELQVVDNATSPRGKQYVWEIYVPYPEPGSYYLMVVSRPLKNNVSRLPVVILKRPKRAENDEADDELEKELKGRFMLKNTSKIERNELEIVDNSNSGFVAVQFQATMQQCFDGITCGGRGRCRLSLLGGSLVTTSCECFNGYRGLNCNDATRAVTAAQITMSIFALTASNAVYVPAAVIAWYRHYQLEAIIYVATAIFSTLYHLCDRPPDGNTVCVLDYQTLQFADFYAAVLSVWVTLIALAELPHTLVLQLSHIAGSIGIAVVVRHNATALSAFLIPCAVGIVILLASWAYRKFRLRAFYPSVPYLVLHFVPGVCVAIAGLLMFSWLQTEQNYQLVHSVWHVIMGVAIVIILPTRALRHGMRSKPPSDSLMPCDFVAAAATSAVAVEEGSTNHAASSNSLVAVAPSSNPLAHAVVAEDAEMNYAADVTPISQCRSSRSYFTPTSAGASSAQSDEIRLECVSLVDSCTERVSIQNDNQNTRTVAGKSAIVDYSATPAVDIASSSIKSLSSLVSSSSSGGCHTMSSSERSVAKMTNLSPRHPSSSIPAVTIFKPNDL